MAVTEPSNTELVQPSTTEFPLSFNERVLTSPRSLATPALAPTWYATTGKRVFDIVVGSLIAVAIVPFLALAAVIVVLSIGRPLFYRQLRVGEFGRPFRILKYRTMRPEPVIDLTEGNSVGLVVDVHDRTTAGSRMLRALSLDELPQIFNVLSGKMSLVGPRPEVWGKAAQHGLVDHPRNQVKPGMTGLWQISPERRGDIIDGVMLDLEYVQTVSLVTDLKILLRTPLAVLRSDTE